MVQYWGSRFKIEKLKNPKRVTCLMQTTLIDRLWKPQSGRRKKSIQKAQRYSKRVTTHRASEVQNSPLWMLGTSVFLKNGFASLCYTALGDGCAALEECCTIGSFELYVHHYCHARNTTHSTGSLHVKAI